MTPIRDREVIDAQTIALTLDEAVAVSNFDLFVSAIGGNPDSAVADALRDTLDPRLRSQNTSK